jgi:hypothetical protein
VSDEDHEKRYFPGAVEWKNAALEAAALEPPEYLGVVFHDQNEPQFWLAWIPGLQLMTQGFDQNEAFEMAIDLLKAAGQTEGGWPDLDLPLTIERLPDHGNVNVKPFRVVTTQPDVLATIARKRTRPKFPQEGHGS